MKEGVHLGVVLCWIKQINELINKDFSSKVENILNLWTRISLSVVLRVT